MLGIISKKNVRQVKMFLVSGSLEKVLLFVSITILLIVECTNDIFQNIGRSTESFFFSKRIESSVSNISSLQDWYTWLKGDFADLAITTNIDTSSNKKFLFGAPRLFNIYLDYPPECLINDRDNVKDYLQYCYPFSVADLSSLIASSIIPPSKNSPLCITSNCSEFKKNTVSKLFIQSKFLADSAVMNAFTVEIPSKSREEFQNTISTQLELNNWLSPISSRMFGIEFIMAYSSDSRARIFQIVIENWLGKYQVSVNSGQTSNLVGSDMLLRVLLSVYLTVTCLSQFKLMIECNYIYKQRYILIQLGLIAEMGLVLLYFLEISRFQALFENNNSFSSKSNQSTSFVDSSGYLQLTSYRVLFSILNLISLPWKILNLFSWIRHYPYFVKFSNLVFRTYYGLLRLISLIIIIIFFWEFGIFTGLKRDNEYFDSYGKAIVSFFTYDRHQETLQQQQMNSMSLGGLYFIYLSFLSMMHEILLAVIFAVVAAAVTQANDFEFDMRSPFQVYCSNQVSDVCKKLDKFERQTLSFIKGKQRQVNDKIIIWLMGDINTFSTERQLYCTRKIKNSVLKREIKLIEFSLLQEVHEFLEYLFKLRPNLLSQSQHYFRIILDFAFPKQASEKVKSSHFSPRSPSLIPLLTQAELQDLISKQIIIMESFLYLLNERGATVPVLFNCRTQMSVNDKARLIKIYNHLQFTSDLYDLKDFSVLMPLDEKQLSSSLDRQQKMEQKQQRHPKKQQDREKRQDQQVFDKDEDDEFSDSDNFDLYDNDNESELYDINGDDDEETFNEENGFINNNDRTTNNLRYID